MGMMLRKRHIKKAKSKADEPKEESQKVEVKKRGPNKQTKA
jgi:hypothetical protein